MGMHGWVKVGVFSAIGLGLGLVVGFLAGWFLSVYAFAVFDAL